MCQDEAEDRLSKVHIRIIAVVHDAVYPFWLFEIAFTLLSRLGPDTKIYDWIYKSNDSNESPVDHLAQTYSTLYGTMTDYATLPLQAHDNRSAFLEHAWNIGRAYRNQAMELISICQFLSRCEIGRAHV